MHDDLCKILEAKETLGLEVNSSKCELYTMPKKSEASNTPLEHDTERILAQITSLAPGIKNLQGHELVLLGAPILPEAMDSVLLDKLKNLELMTKRLEQIDAHDALFLLRSAYAIPKLMYSIRTAPAFKKMAILESYDEKMRQSLETILNVELNDESWQLSSLPVRQGGLGIRLATDLATPAFLSSAHGATQGALNILPERFREIEYKELVDATTFWEDLVNNNAMQPSNTALQANWDSPIFTAKYQKILEEQTCPTEKARIRAIAAEHSSDWLNAIPVPALGLKLDNTSLRLACALRLGSKICQPYKCICGSLVDDKGRHGLSCKNAKGTFSRHQHVNDIIKRALGSAQVTSMVEPTGLTRGDGKRPDGLTLFPWSQGRCLVWDFTCRDTCAPSNVVATSEEAGKAAQKAESDKLAHYLELSTSYIVTPVATETLGSWGKSGLQFIKDIGSRITDHSGEKRATSYLFQSISMAIQRGNVASIRGSVPNTRTLNELYYL